MLDYEIAWFCVNCVNRIPSSVCVHMDVVFQLRDQGYITAAGETNKRKFTQITQNWNIP